ncbi:MAG: cobalamin biosynthesis protein P47K [Proteobacteria bacterium]|nr:cobalamin biosynthesis protein P47K [Pseudomonadota bacterium]
MELIILSGFLGSGKTTLLLRLSQEFRSQGARVAIVVNEIGDIGIDNALLKRIDQNVWELVGGCICCTLASDLIQTLREIREKFCPDKVILEPSGASQPDMILSALECGGSELVGSLHWLALIDPLRLTELLAVLEPLMESYLRHADAAVITKGDLASTNELAAARAWVNRLRPDIRCITAGGGDADQLSLASAAGQAKSSMRELLACI